MIGLLSYEHHGVSRMFFCEDEGLSLVRKDEVSWFPLTPFHCIATRIRERNNNFLKNFLKILGYSKYPNILSSADLEFEARKRPSASSAERGGMSVKRKILQSIHHSVLI